MLGVSTTLICTGLILAALFLINEMGININVRQAPEDYRFLWMGTVTKSGRVIKNGKNALYLGDKLLTPGTRVVVATAAA